MTSNKADLLAEIVRGKTLLKEAPTRRDVILFVYGVDIDAPDPHGDKCGCQKWWYNRKFTGLLRSVRDREYNKTAKKDSLHHHNDFQFYMIRDKETKIWHCVHITQQINGNYLLEWGEIERKREQTRQETIQTIQDRANMSDKLREEIRESHYRERFKRNALKKHGTPQQIRAAVKQLRNDGKLPTSEKDYEPNIAGIQYVFSENVAQVKLVCLRCYDATGDPDNT